MAVNERGNTRLISRSGAGRVVVYVIIPATALLIRSIELRLVLSARDTATNAHRVKGFWPRFAT